MQEVLILEGADGWPEEEPLSRFMTFGRLVTQRL